MKKIILIIFTALLIAGAGFYIFTAGDKIKVKGDSVVLADVRLQNNQENQASDPRPLYDEPLTGQRCAHGNRRPLAVMLAADAVARPLSGISQADIVVEMPVLTGGITRYMAVFSCGEPAEIGSIRSARHPFLPFALSFDSVYAHWGGSYLALDILNLKLLDNIDSIKNPFDVFYRRSDRLAPHNGFTSFDRLDQTIEKLGYRADNQASLYPHIKDEAQLSVNQNISVGYPSPYNVDFSYDYKKNAYARSRGKEKEIDAADQKQVEVKNIIVMIAESRQISLDYNDVTVEGEGDLAVYRNGEVIKGKWKRAREVYDRKTDTDRKYYFLDSEGKEIGLVPGKIWISITQPNQKVEMTFR